MEERCRFDHDGTVKNSDPLVSRVTDDVSEELGSSHWRHVIKKRNDASYKRIANEIQAVLGVVVQPKPKINGFIGLAESVANLG